jgi:hypothetical protein
MDHNQPNDSPNTPEASKVQNGSERFRTIPKASESFGKVRNDSARFGNVPKVSERKENHSLMVREVSRMFEAAGVARTERSITNWCWPNRQGVARLDGYFDPNERRYYITPESVELAIAEEKAKAAKINESSEAVRRVRNDLETIDTGDDSSRTVDWENKIRDLEITNRAKDYFIKQLQKERDGFFDQLLNASRKVGELETKLFQIESPARSQNEGSQNGVSSLSG